MDRVERVYIYSMWQNYLGTLKYYSSYKLVHFVFISYYFYLSEIRKFRFKDFTKKYTLRWHVLKLLA